MGKFKTGVALEQDNVDFLCYLAYFALQTGLGKRKRMRLDEKIK